MLLITQRTNWADEMNIECCFIMSKELWEIYKQLVRERFLEEGEQSVSIGTNEEIIWMSVDEYFNEFAIKEITDKQFDVLQEINIIPINKSLGWIRTLGKSALIEDLCLEDDEDLDE